MTTPAKTAANRRNARHSTGPADTTVTRFNATKHGLLAVGVTELDSPETFAAFCAQLEAELNPVGVVETFLAHRIALGMVRLKRIALLEAEFTTAQLNPPVTRKTGGFHEAWRGEIVVDDPGLPARLPTEAVDALANTFARYETLVENRLFRALNQLGQMQRLRLGEKPGAAAGPPVASFGNSAPCEMSGTRARVCMDEPGSIIQLAEPPTLPDSA